MALISLRVPQYFFKKKQMISNFKSIILFAYLLNFVAAIVIGSVFKPWDGESQTGVGDGESQTSKGNGRVLLSGVWGGILSVFKSDTFTCTTSSPDCCWVWKVRESMNLSLTGASATNATSCCSLGGITCQEETSATDSNVVSQGFFGSHFKSKGVAEFFKSKGDAEKSEESHIKGIGLASYDLGVGNFKNSKTSVTVFDLGSKNITGPIPAEIGNLKSLTTL